MKTFELSGVKYWGPKEKRFEKYKHFQIYDYKDVVTSYLKTSNDLKPNHEKFGWNERPINSDIDTIKKESNWDGFDPMYFNVHTNNNNIVMAKADVISMDMVGLGRDWNSFLYLTIPYTLINKYMTNMHDNEDVTIARKFIKEVENTVGWDTGEWKEIEKKYDLLYPDTSTYTDYYETHTCIKWKQDFDIRQYMSIKKNGLLFPICYNGKDHILKRGTHRAVLLAMTKSDIPIFLQWPFMDKDKNNKDSYKITTPNYFGGNSLKVIVKPREEILDFYTYKLNQDKFIGRLKV